MRPLLLGGMLILGCCRTPQEGLATDRGFGPEDGSAIREVMADQVAAWDRGDIIGFMSGYADSACFIGPKGTTCGRDQVTANYMKSYPDQAAMGRLTFTDLEVLGAGSDHAWCTGRWNLARVQDTLGGGFSLFWVRTPAGWHILRDHTY